MIKNKGRGKKNLSRQENLINSLDKVVSVAACNQGTIGIHWPMIIHL
jgi:hypothetical protein